MPALPPESLLNTLLSRNATATNTTTADVLQVVCAWPVSGQYGPGSRVLYYVLIATCVFARRAEWLRNACLAAALLFPAVAAIHGIVLAAVHVDGAVDMDVYGAFQLCSIGILAAQVTVRHSRTYFFDPGRNTIFVWTVLVLAGLLSLTVEFIRIRPSDCPHDDNGVPLSPSANAFNYNANITCGLTCSIAQGPSSPLRQDAQNNIYVIPAPDKLTSNTATLLAAACCIPAVLSLIFMWNKILEINWKTRFGRKDEDELLKEPIEGTNGATVEKMRGVNNVMRFFLSTVEIPVFGAAVLAIIIIGEENFFSRQVQWQTEPIASIGQWAPIVGTGLALLGSLYLLFAVKPKETMPMHHCNCSAKEVDGGRLMSFSNFETAPDDSYLNSSAPDHGRGTTSEEAPATIQSDSGQTDVGNRRKVARTLRSIGKYLGTPAHGLFDDSEFKNGKALDFPEIPGEEYRNSDLPQIRKEYNQARDADGNITPGGASRAASITNSVVSRIDFEGSPTWPRVESPSPPSSPSPTMSRVVHTNTLPAGGPVVGPQSQRSSSSTSAPAGVQRPRRDTLQVPPVVHYRSP